MTVSIYNYSADIVLHLSTADIVLHLSTADIVLHLSTADIVLHFPTADIVLDLSTADIVLHLPTADIVLDLSRMRWKFWKLGGPFSIAAHFLAFFESLKTHRRYCWHIFFIFEIFFT